MSTETAMRVAVFGLGYVGAVTASCLAREGHDVVGVDLDQDKVEAINAGFSPIMEPGMEDLVAEAHRSGRLRAVADAPVAVRGSEVSLVCVGTPSKTNGDLDLSFIERVTDDIGTALAGGEGDHLVMFRSTMLPGTVEDRLVPILERCSGRRSGANLHVAMCPEFLREARGVEDFYRPPFTVVGSRDPAAFVTARGLFSFLDAPFHAVDTSVAEALKYACNAFHAVKVTFANELGRFCQASGTDARTVFDIFCQDHRLNISSTYLRPGFSFGGSCLPKDLRATVYRSRALDVELPMLTSVLLSNDHHLRRAIDWVVNANVRSAALFGLSFKAGTDDLRESPYVELAEWLLGKGLTLRLFDPSVHPERLRGTNQSYVERHLPHLSRLLVQSPSEALQGTDCAIVAVGDDGVRDALIEQPPRMILDLSGLLGSEVEALPGYRGIAW